MNEITFGFPALRETSGFFEEVPETLVEQKEGSLPWLVDFYHPLWKIITNLVS
jgi:hypothetical protein